MPNGIRYKRPFSDPATTSAPNRYAHPLERPSGRLRRGSLRFASVHGIGKRPACVLGRMV